MCLPRSGVIARQGQTHRSAPYVIAPLIQILARRSYNIKSDGK